MFVCLSDLKRCVSAGGGEEGRGGEAGELSD